MHIQVLRGPFVSTLAQIQGVIEAKRTLPILSHLLLEAKENAISISGTDLDVSIRTTLDGDVKNEGRVAVSGKKLYEIARELPDSSIEGWSSQQKQLMLCFSTRIVNRQSAFLSPRDKN